MKRRDREGGGGEGGRRKEGEEVRVGDDNTDQSVDRVQRGLFE